MTLLTRAETLAFAPETADALRRGGFTLGLVSTSGVLALGTFSGGGFQPWLLIFAVLAMLPALTLLALSAALPARRAVVLPLTWLLCGFLLMLIRATMAAAAGFWFAPLVSVISAVEVTATIALAWFAWHLFRSGALAGEVAR
ncbi:hypothetical protein FHY55_05790 [Oceanicola sp. D3]|uniref:hypothetical protein n=1 Tax=Oceanicola sp. D3 TaxID=2587163 RepID=UPI00111EACED|nr:hypothetical protein [Oceanicola sp. D3]QDC08776.1 hypothetical protein FHY55_05790 [Oceanicola sp. D3]